MTTANEIRTALVGVLEIADLPHCERVWPHLPGSVTGCGVVVGLPRRIDALVTTGDLAEIDLPIYCYSATRYTLDGEQRLVELVEAVVDTLRTAYLGPGRVLGVSDTEPISSSTIGTTEGLVGVVPTTCHYRRTSNP